MASEPKPISLAELRALYAEGVRYSPTPWNGAVHNMPGLVDDNETATVCECYGDNAGPRSAAVIAAAVNALPVLLEIAEAAIAAKEARVAVESAPMCGAAHREDCPCPPDALDKAYATLFAAEERYASALAKVTA